MGVSRWFAVDDRGRTPPVCPVTPDGRRCTLHIDVWLTAHVHGDELERAACEAPRPLTREVHRDSATAPPNREGCPSDRKRARLRADASLADLPLCYVEREYACRGEGRFLAILDELC